ncbi:3-isopropylmalate dehydrogenase [Leuconostoc litchii]|uniref:3-isopropylmalate dehydrogenase n=1 Tax=Leuconostoc litchii TaxID=1981069 RepID=A0A6P2CMX4_9LACO|nr:isocitrate/isopropylmalate family dehydrogenase [Leuconostoc litchii]TYC46305.1 3-isopropylmalate dehydrogenase [Leuconostoc litchii]GMA70024.1 3-isopropylmalate dehydrogenase [Leuconostoc litchii]
MTYKLAILKGDKIAGDVIDNALNIVKQIVKPEVDFDVITLPFGENAIRLFGEPLPNQTLRELKKYDAILIGLLDFDSWDSSLFSAKEALIALKKFLNIKVEWKTIKISDKQINDSPLKYDVAKNTDFVIVQGVESFSDLIDGNSVLEDYAQDIITYEQREVEQVITAGFELAMRRQKHVTVVTGFDAFETSKFWASVAERVSQSYPEVVVKYDLATEITSCILQRPANLDVVIVPRWIDHMVNQEAQQITGLPALIPVTMKNSKNQLLYELPHIHHNLEMLKLMEKELVKFILKEYLNRPDLLDEIGV